MKALYTLVILCLATIGYGQEVTRKIDKYSSLVVGRGVDVRLVKSSSGEMIIRTHGVDPDNVITEFQGGELEIKVATKSLWQEMQDNHWWVRIELPYQFIDNMEVNTGAKISSEQTFVGDILDVQVNMGGELDLNVKLNELIIDSSMGGVAEATGSAKNLELSASMGAIIDLRELMAEVVQAKSSMGAEIMVHATKEFDGRANMGGLIKVSGDPPKFYESTTMGGEISGGV